MLLRLRNQCILHKLLPLLLLVHLSVEIEWCSKEHFRCDSGQCIQHSMYCDGVLNCDDGSDEKHCDECPLNHFHCKTKFCIPDDWVCNKKNDCGDFSDEIHCDSSVSVSHRFGNCSKDEFKCSDGMCIPEAWRCDFADDCQNGADEKDCQFAQDVACAGLLCNHECVDVSHVCDGRNDCDDGSDERNCDSLKPIKVKGIWQCHRESSLSCNDGSLCIDAGKFCDKIKDCPDGSDEGKGCEVKACAKKGCSQKCIQTPTEPLCVCFPGYELESDNVTCSDIDECADNVCSQWCVNTPGNFTCSCEDGYRQFGTECKAPDPEPLLIFSSDTDIKSIHLRSRVFTSIRTDRKQVVAVAYDAREERVHWCDVSAAAESISSSKLDGSDVRTTVWTGLQLPEDLIVDWIAWNLYFTDSGSKLIGVCSLLKDSCSVIIKKKLFMPRAITIEIENRWIFWTDWGHTAHIGRAGMDGSDSQFLVRNDIIWPNGLAIDPFFKLLYWSDAKWQHIECVDFNGGNRRTVLEKTIHHPYHLAIFEDTLYYSDWYRHTIESCDKRTGKNKQTLVKEAKKLPIGLHIYHPLLQKQTLNPCGASLCSHQCVLRPKNSYRCLCPAGNALAKDSKTCIEEKNATFILVAVGNKLAKFHPDAIGNNVFTELKMKNPPLEISAIVYDDVSQIVYMADQLRREIVALNIATMETTVVASEHLQSVRDMVVDKLGGNLYWVDTNRQVIEAMSLKNRARAIIYETKYHPISIALVQKISKIFVGQMGVESRIESMNLDGTGRSILKRIPGLIPSSLAVDVFAQRVFWSDLSRKTINYVSFDGKTSQVRTNNTGRVSSMLIHSLRLYWSEESSSNVYWIRSTVGKNHFTVPLLYKNSMNTPKLAIIRSSQDGIDIRSTNPCKSNPCSHLCLLNPVNYTCACPVDFVADSTGTCRSTGLDQPKLTTFNNSITCDQNHFLCEDVSRCIPPSWRCDNSSDCDDESDEKNCNCNSVQFKCNDNQCIPLSWQCDGDKDCTDGSDEDCERVVCNAGEFRCSTGQCISSYVVCDTHADCTDGSDEINCHFSTCGENDFRCETGQCIGKEWVCDKDIDCPGGEDETSPTCDKSNCAAGTFPCTNSRCVDSSLHCDGVDDCEDGSDEIDCVGTKFPMCPLSMIPCRSSSKCIPSKAMCDGLKDCPNGEDEMGCAPVCSNKGFLCSDGECIPKEWTCDGDQDCVDNDDELSCGAPIIITNLTTTNPPYCTRNEFRCDSGQCIPLEAVCDWIEDCHDGSDETGRCASFSCSDYNGGCSQICEETKKGIRCSCETGYYLMDDAETCIDIDECVEGVCSQKCENTDGSYICYCVDGYRLKPDGKTCRAEGVIPKLILAYPTQITTLSLDQKMYKITFLKNSSIADSDFDVNRGHVYWIDSEQKTINRCEQRRCLLSIETVYLPKFLPPPNLLAVDWIANDIYYVFGTNFIYVCAGFHQDNCVTIATGPSNKNITSIALEPKFGFMFWSVATYESNSPNGRIYRSWMDGHNTKMIVDTKLLTPSSLTVDFVDERLYWIDTSDGHIDSCNFEGRDRRTVARVKDEPSTLTLLGDYIYWHDSKGNLFKCRKRQCRNSTLVHHDVFIMQDLFVYHSVKQPLTKNRCETASCSHICALTPRSYSCLCPEPLHFTDNSTTQCEVPVAYDEKNFLINNCSLLCDNYESCTVTNGTARCNCISGFRGELCEVEITPKKARSTTIAVVIILILLFLAIGLFILYLIKRSKTKPFKSAFKSLWSNQVTDQLPTIRFSHPRNWIYRRGPIDNSDRDAILSQDFSNPGFRPLPTLEPNLDQRQCEILSVGDDDPYQTDHPDTEYLITDKPRK